MVQFRPNSFPGKLIIVEGIDGSGKSTQLSLLSQWLRSRRLVVSFSEWNSSPIVKGTTRRGKKKQRFTPTSFSLIHATDFADRLERHILPMLEAGAVVCADRYAYTAFARDVARGVQRAWVRNLYRMAVEPDLAFLFRVPLNVALQRILGGRSALKHYEAGNGPQPEPGHQGELRPVPAAHPRGIRLDGRGNGLPCDRCDRNHPGAAEAVSGNCHGTHRRFPPTRHPSPTLRELPMLSNVTPLEFYEYPLPGVDIAHLQGKLIAIEGPDSVGRSTQVQRLRAWLEERGLCRCRHWHGTFPVDQGRNPRGDERAHAGASDDGPVLHDRLRR